jgi:lysophospholipid acyltransferase (LPLAT)-like uncharacterized protein
MRSRMMRSLLARVVGRLGPAAVRFWFSTIRLRWYGGEFLHPDPRTRRNAIGVFWHQRLLCFGYSHGQFGPRILISTSRDGDLIARVAAGLGCVPIRGSSRRGRVGAMRGLLAAAKSGHDIAITPDGPLGPLHVFQPGAVYLASQTGLAVVPLSVSYGRCWRFRSWDRFIVPWPFTWGVLHVGEGVPVPSDLDEAGLETWRVRLQTVLREHTDTTDARAVELYRAGRPYRDL